MNSKRWSFCVNFIEEKTTIIIIIIGKIWRIFLQLNDYFLARNSAKKKKFIEKNSMKNFSKKSDNNFLNWNKKNRMTKSYHYDKGERERENGHTKSILFFVKNLRQQKKETANSRQRET